MVDSITLRQLTIERPFVLEKSLNSIKLAWNDPKIGSEDKYKIVYILEIRELVGSWKRIHWGLNTFCLVTNLRPGPDFIYGFRLKAYIEVNGEIEKSSESEWSQILYTTAKRHPLTLKHLHRAINAGKNHDVKEIAKSQPSLVDTENTFGQTALVLAIENNNSEMTLLLLNLGADIDKPALNTLRTPLMTAIIHGHLAIAKILIDRGANINVQDINDCTVLHHAVDTNRFENVEFILRFHPIENIVDRSKWTPLLRAVVMDSNIEIIQLLIEDSKDVNVKDLYKLTCHDHAILNNRNDLIVLFAKEMTNQDQ